MKSYSTSCNGKVSYASRDIAHLAKSAMIHKRGERRQKTNIYHCVACSGFHIGRDRREQPPKLIRPIADHRRDSFKSKWARYLALTR